jgi:glycosyltransferase involved in cell wall biosynthesis
MTITIGEEVEMLAWEPLLSVVVPAYNEESGVSDTLRELRTRLPNSEIIVVDDASTDATYARASEVPGVTVISHAYNCGYGGALKTGMIAAKGKYVAWFDADGEHRVDDLVAMADRLHREQLIAVIGQRQDPSPSTVRAVGKWLIRALARSLKLRGGIDLNCGLRVFRRDIILRYVHLLPEGFSASLTSLMVLLERGYPIALQPITVGRRVGRSKVKIADGFASLVLVLRMAMLFAPLRIFFRLGGLFMLLGLLYSFWIALMRGAGIPVGGALMILFGVVVLSLGLIADQISQLRLTQLAPPELLPSRPIRLRVDSAKRLTEHV